MKTSSCHVLLLALLPWVGSAHDDDHWEWVGVFNLIEGKAYTWTAEKDHDKYADASMQMVVYPVDEADGKSVKAIQEKAEKTWHSAFKNVTAGKTIEISSSAAGNLIFDQDSWVTLYYLRAEKTGSYAFFCQHFPIEFEQQFHYFKDDHGHDIEPDYVWPEPTEAPGASAGGWGLSLGGTFLTTVPALLMVFIVGPGITKLGDSMKKVFPFCSGAIGGAAAFLILPEATHFMPAWLWGTAVLLGWLLGVWIHHITDLVAPAQSHALHQHHARTSATDIPAPLEVELAKGGNADGEQAGDSVTTTSSHRTEAVLWAAASPILFGDAIHGFVDGLVIGFSAKHCGPAMTWTIIVATIVHEVPVEVSTITVLVTQAKMRLWQATWWNFFSAQTALLGALAGYGVAIPDAVQGFALALCGGIFIFIAFTELSPQLLAPKTSCGDSLCSLFLFAFGAACLGLVLLNHEHCSVGGGDGGGHGHGGH